MSDLLLSPAEIQALTHYKAPTLQLNELRQQGFWRARIGRHGVILERSHYEAVSRGDTQAPTTTKAIKLPSLRLA